MESLSACERAAVERASPDVWAYIQGGSEDERTLRRNRSAFSQLLLRPRMLSGVERADTRVRVMGTSLPTPLIAAPVGLQRLAHPSGELATARALAALEGLMVVSTMSTVAVELLADTGCKLWFQLYVLRDRGLTREIIERAQRASCRALVVTVDAPRLGRRERDMRNGFVVPAELALPHLAAPDTQTLHKPLASSSALASHAAGAFAAVDWPTIEWVRSQCDMPLILKGVMTAQDAREALQRGVDGVIVSNHGGRQLDGTASTLEALDEVASAFGGACELFVDGGFRRGVDVVKAGALGAAAVMIGRPIMWGLLTGGEPGVRAVFEQLQLELEHALVLAGYHGFSALKRDAVAWSTWNAGADT